MGLSYSLVNLWDLEPIRKSVIRSKLDFDRASWVSWWSSKLPEAGQQIRNRWRAFQQTRAEIAADNLVEIPPACR